MSPANGRPNYPYHPDVPLTDTIAVSHEVKQKLLGMKRDRLDAIDDVLRRLLGMAPRKKKGASITERAPTS